MRDSVMGQILMFSYTCEFYGLLLRIKTKALKYNPSVCYKGVAGIVRVCFYFLITLKSKC